MKEIGWFAGAFWLFVIALGVSNTPDKYTSKKFLCQEPTNVLYTNVGTPIYDTQGKLVPCLVDEPAKK